MNPNGKNAPSIDGTSLLALLHNPKATNWKGPSLALTTKGKPDSVDYAMRSKRYRYIYTKRGQEELYDHKTDPNEWYNLADNEQYHEIKNEMHDRLSQLIFDLQK